ncbi:MAG: D-alanine--D-alanine ligase [Bacteroidales bacterium]|nr:D-alanine--D-alanine ligase [Bacteroidales bacterium]
MKNYQAIAVIYGSDSSEWEVSCRSGEFVASRIDGSRFDIYEVFARNGKWSLVAMKKRDAMRIPFPEGSRPELDKTDFSVQVYGKKVRFDFAYIVQHGIPGENGQIQGYLEMLGIPFSSCGAFTSAVAFDKYSCKTYIKDIGAVKCAPDALIHKGDDIPAFCARVAAELRFPVFVKPTSGGSSFGISRVTDPSELEAAIAFAFQEDRTVLVEQGVAGRELTCAAWKDGDTVKALPVIEIIPEGAWFDYDAKYNGHSREVCPAEIPDAVRDEVQRTTCRLYSHLGCSGVVRIDYIYAPDGLYFLEVNTIPGMTSASLVPKMVRAAGMDMTDFLTSIIESA